jgi:Tfp pilus assembly protein PilN
MKNKQSGYILPFVVMVSSLVFFILFHEVTLYHSELTFYKEKQEITFLERLLQKTLKELKPILQENNFTDYQFFYEEGNVIINFETVSENQHKINIYIETTGKRKSKHILYYNIDEQNVEKWIEGR